MLSQIQDLVHSGGSEDLPQDIAALLSEDRSIPNPGDCWKSDEALEWLYFHFHIIHGQRVELADLFDQIRRHVTGHSKLVLRTLVGLYTVRIRIESLGFYYPNPSDHRVIESAFHEAWTLIGAIPSHDARRASIEAFASGMQAQYMFEIGQYMAATELYKQAGESLFQTGESGRLRLYSFLREFTALCHALTYEPWRIDGVLSRVESLAISCYSEWSTSRNPYYEYLCYHIVPSFVVQAHIWAGTHNYECLLEVQYIIQGLSRLDKKLLVRVRGVRELSLLYRGLFDEENPRDSDSANKLHSLTVETNTQEVPPLVRAGAYRVLSRFEPDGGKARIQLVRMARSEHFLPTYAKAVVDRWLTLGG